jgi:hypothetical protein
MPSETRATCAACGAAIFAQAEPDDAPTALPPLDALVLLRVAHAGWATALSEALETSGIAHRIAAETGGRTDLPRFGVFVRREDATGATAIDSEVLRGQLPDLPEGYDPTALREGECPACGTHVDASAAECPECGLALLDA